MTNLDESLHWERLASETSPLGAGNSDGAVDRRGAFTEARSG